MLLLEPERRWYQSSLARHLKVTPSVIQRELASLSEGGLLNRQEEENRVYYQANTRFPLFEELRAIFLKTTGVQEAIDQALQPFAQQIELAFIFGSYARAEQTAVSDIDLLIIGDVQMRDLVLPLRHLQNTLSVEVNVTLYTRSEYHQKAGQENHFIQTVQRAPKLFLKGTEHELGLLVGRTETEAASAYHE